MKILLRFDDIAENMNWHLMDRCEKLFDKYNIKPVMGVIPNNQDPILKSFPKRDNFWKVVKNWQQKGWEISMHGYNHLYKQLNKKTKSIISIFAGRMADSGKDPIPIFKKSINLTKKNKNIEILWASTREAYNFTQAKQIKCNIITMPPKVINQIDKFGKSFNSMTLETVKGFLIDSKKSKFKI